MKSPTHEELDALAGDPNAVFEWIEELLEVGDARLPEFATWAAERGDIDLLLLLMDDYVVNSNMRTVEAIRASLATTGAALGERLGQMLDHEAPEERRAGALFAGLLGLQSLAPRLVAALEDPYFLTRMEAAGALGKLRYLPAVEPLRRALADEDILTRNAAIEALTRIPDPDLLTAYTGRLVDDPPAHHRGAFDDPLPRSRRHAILVLRDLKPPCAREALEFYLDRRRRATRATTSPTTTTRSLSSPAPCSRRSPGSRPSYATAPASSSQICRLTHPWINASCAISYTGGPSATRGPGSIAPPAATRARSGRRRPRPPVRRG